MHHICDNCEYCEGDDSGILVCSVGVSENSFPRQTSAYNTCAAWKNAEWKSVKTNTPIIPRQEADESSLSS